ncbi:hypothetical protein BELL_0184g00070 [Botrytis elliptica]|uniref:SWIM-type domain-containing protein n=1 Tax=Botrytis elliptica TaxID=278938 RepID=A0A4Z1JQQ5_9HELO|nr:hypothetical protein EAE99_003346 [Botrytis elliptica]TGO75925.1 hypothetical protein BELL_0184g00070 [Botrytis elliptica]
MSTNHPAPLLPSQSPSPSPSLSLPSSRDFMTSLFNSLTSSSRSSTSPIQTSDINITSDSISYTRKFSKENERDDGDGNGNGNGNPLKQLDAQKKALLMTLHVIFPPPLLLHALDLLDRGGVGRVVLKGEGGIEEGISKREGRGDRRDDARGDMEQHVSSEREKEAESRRNLEVEDTEGGATTTKAHNPQATPSTSTCASACISPHKNYSPLAPVQPSPNHRSPPKTKPTSLYQVRSSQPPKWHSSRSASGIGIGTGHASASAENTYTVHLDAWNCSCAAFAFSAFPAFPASSSSSSSTHPYPYISTSTSPSTSTSSPLYFPWSLKESSPDEDCSNSMEKGRGKRKEEEEKWQYGGWTKTSQVPICKHLLACLLVERWGDVLGMYVRERVVGREEMGGLVV